MADDVLANDIIDVARLRAAQFVDRIEHHETLGSTNDYLRQVAGSLPRDETMLVVADRQTAGRGRGANRWWTGSGSLAASLLFDPAAHGIATPRYPMISLTAAVALIETVAPLVPRQKVSLHWPNDVFVGERKLAGILVEAIPDGRHVLGIGCNVNNRLVDAPSELAARVVTLADLTDCLHHRSKLLLVLLGRLYAGLAELAERPEQQAARANELCSQHGERLTIKAGNRVESGRCAGIAADGALLLDTSVGRQRFYSGVLAPT
jgi:BirA family transcriptional regulator, biotin operon repressor / biotin---[acetyl-CoA-carboxylase] ligase